MSRLLSALAVAAAAVAWIPAQGSPTTVLDRSGAPLPPRVAFQLAASGIAGTTTLDGSIQRVADEALDDGMTEARSAGLFPTGGAVVVLGVKEHALLALASAPEPDRSRATVAIPAGSVVKPVVALAALGQGLDPREPLPCPARFTAGGSTIRNWKRRDQSALVLPEAISQSCNTVFASLAARLWNKDQNARLAIRHSFLNFGFGFPTGLVPGEAPGWVPHQPTSLGDLMVLSIGQGPLTVTPLQVAMAFAAIGSESKADWLDLTGRPARTTVASPRQELLEPVREGLELAVREGTARASFEGIALDRLPIAGKTGSAEVGDATPYAWFSMYAPANRPRYVVTVVVERGRAGALSAAPIARRVLDRLLDLPRERPPFPFPHPAAALLALPLLAALASQSAGSIAGMGAGIAAAAIAGGSVAANMVAFSAAGWIAGAGRRRNVGFLVPAFAAAVGTIALPATERPAWWIAARAAVVGTGATLVLLGRRGGSARPHEK